MSVAKLQYHEERLEVAKTALSLLTTGLVVNTSGNVSVRNGSGQDEVIIITPSGRPYEALKPEDICVLDMDGKTVDGDLLPSSETPLHLAVYRSNKNVRAIVHTHSVHATAVSMLVDELPTLHYQMVDLGGAVPVAEYATFGSEELAQSVLDVLPGFNAVLMKNHGSISTGPDLAKALSRTILLEWCAEVWLKAVAVGDPEILSKAELDRVKKQMQRIASEREQRLAARSVTTSNS